MAGATLLVHFFKERRGASRLTACYTCAAWSTNTTGAAICDVVRTRARERHARGDWQRGLMSKQQPPRAQRSDPAACASASMRREQRATSKRRKWSTTSATATFNLVWNAHLSSPEERMREQQVRRGPRLPGSQSRSRVRNDGQSIPKVSD